MSLGGSACRRCGRGGATSTNILGERVCARCRAAQLGIAAGALRGGSAGEEIATATLFQRLWGRLRRTRE